MSVPSGVENGESSGGALVEVEGLNDAEEIGEKGVWILA